MSTQVDAERILGAFLAPEHERLPDRVLEAAFDTIARTPQRPALRVPWRFPSMPALSRTTALAATVLVATLAAGGLLYAGIGGRGPVATSIPTVAPTVPPPSPTPIPTPGPLIDGLNPAGVYTKNLGPATKKPLAVTFTLADTWEWFGSSLIPDPLGAQAPGGGGILFLDVTSLNHDPCHWRGAGDLGAGTTVSDLVAALEAQTAYAVADPVDVTIGGFSGQRVDITGPTKPFSSRTDVSDAPACDDGEVILWSTREHGAGPIHLQGPANRWQANILDVEGTRLVIVVQHFPGTKPTDRAKLDAVVNSMVITP